MFLPLNHGRHALCLPQLLCLEKTCRSINHKNRFIDYTLKETKAKPVVVHLRVIQIKHCSFIQNVNISGLPRMWSQTGRF